MRNRTEKRARCHDSGYSLGMANIARTGVHPAIAALRDAPKGESSMLTAEDRVRLEENRQRRARGERGVSQEAVEAMLVERKRREG